ncbi:MAG: GtrA family protein [Candidatus Saccharimonadales bacterium]
MKNKAQIIRFGLVGGTNTVIDFGLLFLFKSLGLPVITSNILSTTTAFCFSFFANKKYTFKTTGSNIHREVALFIAVTLFGLWVLQTIVIKAIITVLSQSGLSADMALLIAKLTATIVTLIWNYILYDHVVFKQPGVK